MKKSFLFIIMIAVFSACSSSHKEELKQVEELELKVNTLNSTFDGVDFDRVKEAMKTYKENMAMVKKYYQKDTIEIEFGNMLNRYKGIKKAGHDIDQLHLNYTNDLKMMKTQLGNLKTDIMNNAWEEDSIKSYIEFENEKVEELGDNIGTFILNCEYIIETHDSLANKVREYTVIF